MCLPFTAPRWVGGSGARAEGPFAPGGQAITLLVIRSDRVDPHIRWYRERDPENGYPDRRPSTPGRRPHPNSRRQRSQRNPAWIADQVRNDTGSASRHHFVRLVLVAVLFQLLQLVQPLVDAAWDVHQG